MPNREPEPAFLPLTVAAARTAAARAADDRTGEDARTVQRRAVEADSAAADCWLALLAGCDTPGRRGLSSRLRALSEATSAFAGPRCLRRVGEAEVRVDEAVRDGDGAEFAEALVGYDQAVATAVVSVRGPLGSTRA
ncbi:hypothetical protein LX15_002620 [Streptoalloteichus tenebrarius]|uniref:Uncharacterized protein n=1 Tax=Streptoalloteichus tenebrarius (strain ATCC 17920 / DSM 40477 / JCM 4838 / CBS 697.72 / NBRC 16177 / NCIMB 11028 / NRRL B-12390 / A12253. 1 / ISP 5477) TaxID=1933 RepID=A0ABT1HTU5_STRSD|nr:hypothetical protein [Streptoalloteichus tenebrarius]MCP2258921.1 hypothetical protein [Streptoalloteichus tenebrarius]BFF01128.1 hypothetical protein GCM10020241_28030 [Streptoalloteichus tenebrarius]